MMSSCIVQVYNCNVGLCCMNNTLRKRNDDAYNYILVLSFYHVYCHCKTMHIKLIVLDLQVLAILLSDLLCYSRVVTFPFMYNTLEIIFRQVASCALYTFMLVGQDIIINMRIRKYILLLYCILVK